eukprot:RCo037953
MVLEATFICVDNSEYMRNGDLPPTRMGAVHEACNLVVGAKTQINPENSVGLVTMAGKRGTTVVETLTSNVGKLLAALSSLQIVGDLKFTEGIQVAVLGLKHRQNKQQRQRVVAFVGSPLKETSEQLEQLGKKLKKNSVAIDVVSFGVEDNVAKLEAFVNAVNSQENSHLISVPLGISLADVLVSSPLIVEEGEAGAGGGARPANEFEFGVDPSQDPELAMVLRMSMEDERRRQEAEQKAKEEKAATSGGDTEMKTAERPPQAASPMNMDELSEEAQIELAMKMSMGDYSASSTAQGATSSPPRPSAPSGDTEMAEPPRELTEEEQMNLALKMSMVADTDPNAEKLLSDQAYMAQLAHEIAGLDSKELKKEDKKDEDPGQKKK